MDFDDRNTEPVFQHPDSVTHWTCPKAPHSGMTHHLAGEANKCRYCKRTLTQLQRIQAEVLAAKREEA